MKKQETECCQFQKSDISFQVEILKQLDDTAKKWFEGNRSQARIEAKHNNH